jgi:hypothetical protein
LSVTGELSAERRPSAAAYCYLLPPGLLWPPPAVGSQISGAYLSAVAWPRAVIHDRPFEN